MKFKTKSIVVEAMQFVDTAESISEITLFTGAEPCRVSYIDAQLPYMIITVFGHEYRLNVGDWIIKREGFNFLPCRGDIFDMIFESVL